MNLSKVKLLSLPKIQDERGNLSFLENNNQIPFAISRAYWLYDVPGGEIRGGHAYRELEEVIIALSGSFDLVINDGASEIKYSLNRSYNALYIPNMLWRHIENFSTNSLALIVANHPYNANDYLRNFDEFKLINNGHNSI